MSSGLWSFRRKNPEETINSVLTALPTAAVQVVAASTTLDLLHQHQQQKEKQQHTSSSVFAASPEAPPNQLQSALEETESNENAIDPEWAALRNKWLSSDLLPTTSVQQPQNQIVHDDAVMTCYEDEFEREFQRMKQEDAAAKQWLYNISPEKKSPSSPSPNPNPVAHTTSINNNNSTKNDTNHQVLYYHGLENRGKSLSQSYDDRGGGRGKSSSYSPSASSNQQLVDGDIIDYRSLLARVEKQVMQQQEEEQPRASPHHQLPKSEQEQKFILQTHPSTSSYITVVASSSSSHESPLKQNHHHHLHSSLSSSSTRKIALARANQSLARTDANLEQIVRAQNEVENKKQAIVKLASSLTNNHNDMMKKTSTILPSNRPSSSSSRVVPHHHNTISGPPVRSAVSTKLNFAFSSRDPPPTATTTTTNSSSTNTMNGNTKKVLVDEVVKRSQQISRSASSALQAAHNQQKPSARAALHKSVASKFADPHSNEFKTKLNQDLELIDQEKKKQEKIISSMPRSVVHPQQQQVTHNNNNNLNNNNKQFIRSSSSSARSALTTSTTTSSVVAAVTVDPFVERMMQRTKERDEARKQLLQKYQEEKQAKIQREIQEAEEDAQRTLAERTKAAKLREKMQRKMREDQERKEKLVQLEDAREQMGEALCRGHYLGHVGFYPWRRLVQQKQRIADLLHDHHLVRASFARLKRNVVFERRVREALFVTRCVGLTRLLKRWTMKFVLMKLKKNVLASRRDMKDARTQHLKNCLRRWKRKALKYHAVSTVKKDQWCEEQCLEAEKIRNQMQLRKTFRKWTTKVQQRKDEEERQKIRSKMWSIAMSALTE